MKKILNCLNCTEMIRSFADIQREKIKRCRWYLIKRMLTSLRFLLKYCSAPLSTSQLPSTWHFFNLVWCDNQHAINLFLIIFPRKLRVWLNWEDYSLFTEPLFSLQSPLSACDKKKIKPQGIKWPLAQGGRGRRRRARSCRLALLVCLPMFLRKKIRQRLCIG